MTRSLGGIEVHVVAAAGSQGEGEGPTHLGDAVREFMRRQFDIDPHALDHRGADEALMIEAVTVPAEQRGLPAVTVTSPPPALLENNLARKGVWSVDPDRSQQEFRFETRDVVGSLLVDYSLGQLSVGDMRLVAWLLGRWREDEDAITFTFRGCTREMGLTWSGRRAAYLRRQLTRIHRTKFTGRVYNATTGKRQELLFGILDVVEINDRAEAFDAAVGDATVRVTLSRFIADNLRGGQFVRLRWPILTSLGSDLAQRLYAFLESQKGFRREGKLLYEITVDEQLQASLGSGDRLRRFRAKLAAAGEEICGVDARYEVISLRPGKGRGLYVLSVQRSGA